MKDYISDGDYLFLLAVMLIGLAVIIGLAVAS